MRAEKKFVHKLIAIAGDCTLPGLGLNDNDKQLLISKVHMVFHCAATVRFDENLKVAFNINVCATRDVIELAKQMKNLKVSLNKQFSCVFLFNCFVYSHLFTFPPPTLTVILIKSKSASTITRSIIKRWKRYWRILTKKKYRK